MSSKLLKSHTEISGGKSHDGEETKVRYVFKERFCSNVQCDNKVYENNGCIVTICQICQQALWDNKKNALTTSNISNHLVIN